MADVTPKATTFTPKQPAGDSAALAHKSDRRKAPGLSFRRFFTQAGVSPYDSVQWELRTAQITDAQGEVIFEQKDVEVPKDWSQTATNIVASKYLHGPLDTPERETGVRQLVTRVAETIRDWGMAGGYFRTPEDAAVFHDELVHILLHQMAAFNSPVWFNVGCDRMEPNSDAQNWHWNPQTQRVEFSRDRLPQSAVLGLLHQLRAGFAGVHPDAGQDRGHAVQVGLGHRHQSRARCAAPWRSSAAAASPAARSAS